MTRRLDVLEVHSQRWGLKRMELDVAFAATCLAQAGSESTLGRCLIPAAYIQKQPVASDLEVRNGEGTVISVPTRKDCMTLTGQAIDQLGEGAASLLGAPPDRYRLPSRIKLLIGDVIRNEPLRARICRLEAEELLPQDSEARDWLLPLLRRLEDNYLLWVPIEGPLLGNYHLSIRRSDRRQVDPVFPVKRKRKAKFITIHSQAGELMAIWNPPSKWRRGFDPSALVSRMLVSFGLMPVKFEDEVIDADRFSSFHLEMVPPSGLLVREVKTGRMSESLWGTATPRIRKIHSATDRTVHGEETRTGHVHLEMGPNPRWINSRITIGLRPGTTMLWAVVVLLTCALLWSMRHEVVRLLDLGGKGKPEPDEVQLQIAAAVLLVGPTFAASWMLRLKDPALIRNMLEGTQALLLAAAVLSVSTALVLAGIRPFGWGPAEAVQWYASCSYVVAMPIAVGWLQARGSVWIVYRNLLNRTWKNLVATILMTLLAWVAVNELGSSPALSTVMLFAIGFSLTVVAGNRTSVRLGEVSRLPAAVAGVGAILTLALAGRELEFFNRVVDKGTAHQYGGDLELVVAAVAFAVLCRRLFLYFRAKRQKQEFAAKNAKSQQPVKQDYLTKFVVNEINKPTNGDTS